MVKSGFNRLLQNVSCSVCTRRITAL